MSLVKNAQSIEVSENFDQLPIIMVSSDPNMFQEHSHNLEVFESPSEFEIVIDDIPGATDLSPEREAQLHEEEKEDDNDLEDSKKSKKDPEWDWNHDNFMQWVKGKIDKPPSHSGYDIFGVERVIAYFKHLLEECSKAMRTDLNGKLDSNQIREVQEKLDGGIEKLYERIEFLEKAKGKGKGKDKKKKRSDIVDEGLVKEAQKAMNIVGVVITADLFISRIARVCINSTVSAGKDIERVYADQVKKWNLTDREQASVMQLLADFGYPIRQDRGFMPDEDVDPISTDNYDWSTLRQS